ncbi:FRG domain-containing protein [Moritella viscosa]|uniref:FRG domain-containing protein n=1 Tax=Moritella viscosa TaxID=80854 RepID=A0A1L0CI32_9GAMM|nr:FRG domain-containing protein [Moritella viscosa]SGZ16506.1 Putative uncharacterized protein [Moritella viscosa]SHO15968.1 Putative uncharacterized protein [Moritella viscosa]SHO17752.1 Putative uncharacterized protein [Moritella viscosa]SHO19173.1 Putative uncharacterized protein [Moritella viscosa]
MESITINDIETLHKIFSIYRSDKGFGFWFRGQANEAWPLIPSAGRDDYYLPDNRDLGRLKDWANYAVAHERLPENKIELLALAQHHGLATRLLDWTKNPLVACYFCVTSDLSSDGAIYILETPFTMAGDNLTLDEIKQHEGIISYLPKAFTPRVINQQGLFTIHCPSNKSITIEPSRYSTTEKNIRRIIIPSEQKSNIKEMLDCYGINESTVFPDLDGLSAYINGDTRSIVSKRA